MRKSAWLCLAVIVGISAAIFIRSTFKPTPGPKASIVEAPPASVAIVSNVPSLLNATPPIFDAQPEKLDRHRALQLAKGEEHIAGKRGDVFYLHVHFELEKGWYSYPTKQPNDNVPYIPRTRISISDSASALQLGGEITTDPRPNVDAKFREVMGEDVYRFVEPFMFIIPVRVASIAKPGTTTTRLDINHGAVCNTG